ncbi:dihydroorotase [Pseudoflavonifractor sp. AF19-9AC]|uniref:dihydroorotase n=1 Tax=Pseudoflavonifractor sp. AF19-9AC TaxID=2292244 RepID=UPI000E52EBD1|nr:dihydroorotase [Pseudoflavonifractor sp. AF19-9AC]RHR11131.1 dihydroorotase [Pseudoflavonifractor sp. AF19-9AC]
MKLLIQHGRVVHPVTGEVVLQDLLAEDGKISLLERGLPPEADQIIDATGLVVCPGLVDMHVHLRDPGLTYKEDILTGCAAAARGGVTALACMANTDPTVDCPEQVAYVLGRAKEACGVQVYPIAALSMGLRGEELTDAEALKKAGAVALSDDGSNVDNANLMRDAMIRARRQELPILCHCEDTSMVEGRAVNEGSVSRQLWLEGRPAIAEEIMVMRDAMLAEETGAHVHICHVSTAKSVDIIRRMKKRGAPITCETCPQYFTLTEDEVLTKGSLARVNPPLRTAKDVKGILAGLKDGTIDVIATDHAPHSAEEKARSLTRAPSGMIGLETSLAITLTALYHTKKMELPDIIQRMTTNPADILHLPKGRMSLGVDADLTVFDPDEEWVIDPEQFASKARNTPFAGAKVKGRVKYTIVGGRIIYQDA